MKTQIFFDQNKDLDFKRTLKKLGRVKV